MDLTNFFASKKDKTSVMPAEAVEAASDEVFSKPDNVIAKNTRAENDISGINTESLTPAMRQFVGIKNEHRDCIILFRMGDFYETFYDDAKLVAKELEIVLTSRGKGEKSAPLAGIPYHALEQYLAVLVKKGHKVVIVEQMEDPKKAKGLVKRGVARIVTPGMVMDQSMLDEKSNNYIMALYIHANSLGCAFCDISTGEFLVAEDSSENLSAILSRLQPREAIIPCSMAVNASLTKFLEDRDIFINRMEDRLFNHPDSEISITSHFKTLNTDGFGLGVNGVRAAGALLQHITDTQKTNLSYINSVRVVNLKEAMALDPQTIYNLELFQNSSDFSSEWTLASVLDKTNTPMGSRLLRRWIREPLLNIRLINERLEAVSWLRIETIARNDLSKLLSGIRDMERIISRINYGNAAAKDLLVLKQSLHGIPMIISILEPAAAALIGSIKTMPDTSPIINLIGDSIKEEPAATLREGNLIKPGHNKELDRLREIKKNSRNIIKGLEEDEKKKTGIKTLRIRYNHVFGYFIEVSKSHIGRVPEDYIRRQTTANSERYIIPELKEQEDLILNADEKIVALEYELFQDIIKKISEKTGDIQKIARAIALLDVLVSFAECAAVYNYIRPKISGSGEIILADARHPVLERNNSQFVPNDICLKQGRIMIITGPNMAGKSSVLRQTALIVLMAQIGSFAPCSRAEIGIVDCIFTRVGASDNLAKGKSTFMVEMNETAHILNNATERSLIILDEIGRGTSTFDGVSIAWGIVEFIAENIKAKTLFATHYHILNSLAESYECIDNYNIAVVEDGENITFLHKLIKGGTDRSYGIHVAKLAGIPKAVIERAKVIQEKLEKDNRIADSISR